MWTVADQQLQISVTIHKFYVFDNPILPKFTAIKFHL